MTRHAIALVLFLSSPLFAEDAAAFLAKLDEKYYSNTAAGLKDLSAVVVLDRWPAQGWKDAKAHLSWKAPDRRRARVEGMPADAPNRILSPEDEVLGVLDHIILEPWARRAEAATLSITQADGKTKLVGVPKARTKESEDLDRWTEEFDSTGKLLGFDYEMKGGSRFVGEYTWTEKEGKYLPESITEQMIDPSTGEPTGHTVIRVDYDKVGGFWLPSRVTEESTTKVAWTFSDYKVNSGLDDATFDK